MVPQQSFIRIIRYALPAILLLITFCVDAVAADVELTWSPSPSVGIVGYRVYVGSSSRAYGSPITIGNQTTYTITGLNPGTHYFAVTAYDGSGNESTYSNEVAETISSSLVCDTNQDSILNVLDLQLLANAILGIGQTSSSYDYNRDGSVDALDLQVLNNVILGLRSCQ